VTAKGKQWRPQTLPIDEVREREEFQLRAVGLHLAHANKLLRTLKTEGDLEPVKVARIGKALYLVDGFHRLDAYRRARRVTVPAIVATMSMEEARREAQVANTRHGLNLTRADKQRAFDDYIAAGSHKSPAGTLKSSRTIAAELGNVYSHEMVRQKLKALGLVLDETVEFPGGYKPQPRFDDDPDEVAEDRLEEGFVALRALRTTATGLEGDRRETLLIAARTLLETLERGEQPEEPRLSRPELDI